MQKTIDVDFSEGEGEDKLEVKGQAVLRKLTFGEKSDLDEESSEVKLIGKTPQVTVSTAKVIYLSILKGTVSWNLTKTTYRMDDVIGSLVPVVEPITRDHAGIKGLPQEVGNQLFHAFSEINRMSEKKAETSSSSSTE